MMVARFVFNIRSNSTISLFWYALNKKGNFSALNNSISSIPDQIGHGQNLGVVFKRLRLLTVEGVDVGLHEHVRQYQVLEARRPSRRSALVVVLERFEEICVRLLELTLAQMHLPAALCNSHIAAAPYLSQVEP
jgi:hypothetical protein